MYKLKYLLMSFGVALIGILCVSFTSVKSNAVSNNVYDLSEWQGNFTDNQVRTLKNEVPFVILRVQFGSAYNDKTFAHNVALMKKYGVPYGVYSFSQYTSPSDAASEAKTLYSRAPEARFYVNDYEQQTVKSGGTNAATKAWVNALRPLVGNRKILFYSYQSFMTSHAAEAVSSYDGYWLAAYQTNEPQREHVLWQYTDHFYSPALNQYVDASVLTQKNSSWFIDATNNSNDNNNKPSKPKSNVKYTKENKTLTVKTAVKYNFYNHVPGNNYFSELHRTHYGRTFHSKNVTVDLKATVNGRTYYRAYENGKLLGWINQNGLGPHISYSKVNMYKKVKLNSNYRFYNHVTQSHFADFKTIGTAKDYAGKTVHITGRAIKDGWKTYYYKCYYEGKFIGWIYQRGI
ncbi:hypothetical protein AKUG0406_04590 [Apilactobacillus kunkeei]|nr:hypothetical protein AKUG0406_04590 [Apilactobacillus kunkeei]CAI2579592.1 hypothetical protein AKUG0403_04590 [Apilactobacillus kunkeei]CAI2579845.1 hypothetical protein AKUG0420_04610 [Apilactobacillus kunkeei]